MRCEIELPWCENIDGWSPQVLRIEYNLIPPDESVGIMSAQIEVERVWQMADCNVLATHPLNSHLTQWQRPGTDITDLCGLELLIKIENEIYDAMDGEWQ